MYIYLEDCISILAEKSYLSSRINDQFVCGIQPLQQKLFVKAAVSQFVPFSLSSITLHKLICATTLPFPVSWTPYFDFELRLTSNPNLTRNLIYFSLKSFQKFQNVSKSFKFSFSKAKMNTNSLFFLQICLLNVNFSFIVI